MLGTDFHCNSTRTTSRTDNRTFLGNVKTEILEHILSWSLLNIVSGRCFHNYFWQNRNIDWKLYAVCETSRQEWGVGSNVHGSVSWFVVARWKSDRGWSRFGNVCINRCQNYRKRNHFEIGGEGLGIKLVWVYSG